MSYEQLADFLALVDGGRSWYVSLPEEEDLNDGGINLNVEGFSTDLFSVTTESIDEFEAELFRLQSILVIDADCTPTIDIEKAREVLKDNNIGLELN